MSSLKELSCKVIQHTTSSYEEIDALETHVGKPIIPPFVIQPEEPKNGKYYYGIRIVTGNQSGASPDTHNVILSLTGDKGKSNEITVKAQAGFFFCKTYFKDSTYDELIIECDGDLGDIQVVSAGLQYKSLLNILTPDWYIDYFSVANYLTEVITNFPCYHWIGNSIKNVSVTSATATLQQIADNPVLVEQRANLLQERRLTYQWKMFPDNGVPSGIDDSVLTLPLDEQFQKAKMVQFLGNLFKGKIDTSTSDGRVKAMHTLEKLLEMNVTDKLSLNHLHDFEFIAETVETENIKDATPPGELPIDPTIPTYEGHRWVSDVEFGRQILNGVNPVVIKKCTKIPDYFSVTSDMVEQFMNNGKTFEQEMKDGHVYICDLYEILHDIPTRDGYYCPEPICLLYVNGSKQLVPIAIQLMKDDPVFLPSDGWFEWLLAKMYYRCGHTQYHQISTHYISCHATMEAYGVATMRNLPDAHPVYKLLQPHFRYTMSINSAARASLITRDGIIAQYFAIGSDGLEELMKRVATAHRVQMTNIIKNVKERGVENSEQLPGYYYRDDGIRIWEAIEKFVEDVIDIFYKCDEDIVNDSELVQWAEEMHTTAFPGFFEAPQGHGFPKKIETKKELIEYCTLIIFTGSAQHAAVNFGQFNIYGYTPNAPIGMRKPPPKKTNIMYRDLMVYLPDINTAAMASSITFTLSQYGPDEIFLGGYSDKWYSEKEATVAVERFVTNLKKIDEEIRVRNNTLDVRYHYLCPSRIPNSITI